MILEVADLIKKRNEDYALHIASLGIKQGEHVAILGPSGCGKSTTLDILGMILDFDSARTFRFSPPGQTFDIQQMWNSGNQAAMTELRRKYIGYILQTGEIFGFLNVFDNVELTALASGMTRKSAREKSLQLLDTLEIANLSRAMPQSLSIGQRQRVAIARALASGPSLLLADEPTSALDPVMARKVMELLLGAIKDNGTSLVLVSHDHALISEFGFRKTEIVMNGKEAILDERK